MSVNDSTEDAGNSTMEEMEIVVPLITTPPATTSSSKSSRDRNKIYVGIEKTLSPLKIFEQEQQPCSIHDLYQHKDKKDVDDDEEEEEDEETRLCSDNKSPVSVTDAIAYQESTIIPTSNEEAKGSKNNLVVVNSDQTIQNNEDSSSKILLCPSSSIRFVSSSSLSSSSTSTVNYDASTSLLSPEESTSATTTTINSGTHHKRTLTDSSGIVDVLPVIPESKEIKHVVDAIAVIAPETKEDNVAQEKNVSSASDMIPLTTILPIINATNTTKNIPDSSSLSGSAGGEEAMILQSAIITSSTDNEITGDNDKKFKNNDNKGNHLNTTTTSSNHVTLMTTAASNNMSTTPICMPTHINRISSSVQNNNNNKATTASASHQPSSHCYYERKYFPSPRRLFTNTDQKEEEEDKEALTLSSIKNTPSDENPHASTVMDGRPLSTPQTTTTISNQKGERPGPVPTSLTSSNNDEQTTSKSAFLHHRRVSSLPLSYVVSTNNSCRSQNISSDIVLHHHYYEHELQKQLSDTIQKYGDYHIYVAQTCSKFGTFYFRNGQYIKASHQDKRSLDIIQILKETIGKDKVVTGKRLLALWQNLSSNGNNSVHSNKHLLTKLECSVCTNYGTTLWHLQQPTKSIQYFQRVYNVYCHSRTSERGNAAHNLGSSYLVTLIMMQQKNNHTCNGYSHHGYDNINVTKTMIATAESLLHEALMTRVENDMILDVARTMDMLSTLYGCTIIKQYDKALMWSFKSYHMKHKAQSCKNNSNNNTATVKESLQITVNNISNIYYQMGRYREAFEINCNHNIYQTYNNKKR